MSILEPPKGAAWVPKHYSIPKTAVSTRGGSIARFSERFLKAIDGKNRGKPIILTSWQKWVLDCIFAMNEAGELCSSTDLLMIPRKNGKTTIVAIIIIFSLITAPKRSKIYSAAKDKEQAALVFDMIVSWIEDNPTLAKNFKILKSKKTVIYKPSKAEYKPLSSDGGKTNGLNPYLLVVDELHAFEGLTTAAKARDFWASLTTGGAANFSYKMIVISTSGTNSETSILGELWKKGMSLATGKSSDESFNFFYWSAPEEAPIEEESTWAMANPNLAEGYLSLDYYRSQFKMHAATGLHVFRRMYLNQWVSVLGAPYIQKHVWEDSISTEQFIPGEQVTVGFDGSLTDDSTVIVIHSIDSGVFKVWQAWEKPKDAPQGSWHVSAEEVEESMKRLVEEYSVKSIWVDNTYFESDVVRWGKRYRWPVTVIPQSGHRMISLGIDWKKKLMDKIIFHPGDDAVLNRHVPAAIEGADGRFTKAAKGSREKIDALVAAVLASGARDLFIERRENRRGGRVF